MAMPEEDRIILAAGENLVADDAQRVDGLLVGLHQVTDNFLIHLPQGDIVIILGWGVITTLTLLLTLRHVSIPMHFVRANSLLTMILFHFGKDYPGWTSP